MASAKLQSARWGISTPFGRSRGAGGIDDVGQRVRRRIAGRGCVGRGRRVLRRQAGHVPRGASVMKRRAAAGEDLAQAALRQGFRQEQERGPGAQDAKLRRCKLRAFSSDTATRRAGRYTAGVKRRVVVRRARGARGRRCVPPPR